MRVARQPQASLPGLSPGPREGTPLTPSGAAGLGAGSWMLLGAWAGGVWLFSQHPWVTHPGPAHKFPPVPLDLG